MLNKQQIEEICNYYCGNNMRYLRKICNNQIKRITYLSNADYDDFLSKANETVFLAAKAFDEHKNDNFEGFLISCLQKKFYSEIQSRTRVKKRIPQNSIVYLDAPISYDNQKKCLNDTIASKSDVFTEAFGCTDIDKIDLFINSLSVKQGEIIYLLIEGYSHSEIKEKLSMSTKEFNKNMAEIKAYDNICILF